MAIKRNDLGKVIGQVGGFRVRQISKNKTVKGKTVTSSTSIGILSGKTQIESGFKNKESAILRAKEIQSKVLN